MVVVGGGGGVVGGGVMIPISLERAIEGGGGVVGVGVMVVVELVVKVEISGQKRRRKRTALCCYWIHIMILFIIYMILIDD